MSAGGLERFVEAQEGVYPRALAELTAGSKASHWMWFVFPQIAGLGASPMAQRYAISGLDEARAYLRHPVLGPRLVAAATAALPHAKAGARRVFGSPDDLKFRSSMTLFAAADPAQPVFRQVLDAYFGGEADPATLQRL